MTAGRKATLCHIDKWGICTVHTTNCVTRDRASEPGREAAADERERLVQAVRDLPGYGDPAGGLVSREAVLALLSPPARKPT